MESMSCNGSEPVGSWTPSKARYEFRTNPELEGTVTAEYCTGHLQANLTIVPSSLADELEQFCELNRAPCPLLYRSRRGELSAGIMGQDSDVRTDLASYYVYENGSLLKNTGDLTLYPFDDYVSFYVGCSYTFDNALRAAGIHVRDVYAFICNIQCIPVGPFTSPMVVSMRLFPKELVEKTVVITAAYDAVHGAPIHIGDPSVIGIEDINKVDYGLPHPGSVVGDQIPVFWACGETPGLAVKAAKPPLFFNHDPISSMFICDATVDEYFKIHKPEHGEEQPRLVTLEDQPFLASVCSASAIQNVEKLAKIVESHSGINGTIPVHGADILKMAARLSHAPSVVIGFLHEKESLSSEMSTSDGLKGALALIKALQALKKKITIVTQYHAQLIRDCVTANAAQGISKEGIRVVEVDKSCDIKERVYPGEINHRLDTMIALQVARNTDEDGFEGTKGGLVDTLFKEVNSWENRIVSIKITADRGESSQAGDVSLVDSHVMTTSSVEMATCALAAALYVLNKCPIHSRYVRRGIGRRQLFDVGQFLVNEVEKDGVCSQILHSIKDN